MKIHDEAGRRLIAQQIADGHLELVYARDDISGLTGYIYCTIKPTQIGRASEIASRVQNRIDQARGNRP